ncbi:MAG: 2-phospho-L-lactate guanylyltransferase [Anaerolineaceae bacterium]
MTTWVIVPVKPLDQGKSRLRALFSADELLQFNISLFQSTYFKLKDSPEIDRILVVSRDQQVLEWVTSWGGVSLPEKGPAGLNAAIAQGFAFILAEEPGPVLILPTDLPLMMAEDLRLIFSFAPQDPGALIVPDHRQAGTNALCLSRPDLLPPSFGLNSFHAHCALAEAMHLSLVVYLNRHIQHDIDTPEDLEAIRENDLVNPISPT